MYPSELYGFVYYVEKCSSIAAWQDVLWTGGRRTSWDNSRFGEPSADDFGGNGAKCSAHHGKAA